MILGRSALGQRQEGWKLVEAVSLACTRGPRGPIRWPIYTKIHLYIPK